MDRDYYGIGVVDREMLLSNVPDVLFSENSLLKPNKIKDYRFTGVYKIDGSAHQTIWSRGKNRPVDSK